MSIKRKAAVGAIAVLAALAPVAASAASFSDVSLSYWGYATINWAADNGVVVGYPDGTFKPEQQVTEAEFLAMLLNAYHPQLPKVPIHQWADQFYAFSKQMNYPLSGYDNMSARDWVITRQHVAEILAGASGVNYTGRDAIQYVLAKGLAKGEDPNRITIEGFNGQGLLTRAQAVQFVKNAMDHGMTELKARPFEPSDPKLLPPLPGQQQPQPQPQPTPQPLPPGINLPQPHVDMNNWTPGDSTVLGKALFSNNFKFNNDGTATITIPTAEQLGQPQGAWIRPYYMPPKDSPDAPEQLQPGKTYTLQQGTGASVLVDLWGADGKLIESYTVALDGSGRAYTRKRVNGQLVMDNTSFDALLRGLGVQ
ncbi:MAG TPA: S-layer homology domain-containing protein [Alicyclobacillus sp.]|nr:S-layer homology domain-containing protein [Alicyclobacillus sp.]